MSRRLVLLLVAALYAGCGRSSERTILYRADRPIAERLQPGDTRVVVQMPATQNAAAAGPQESFEQEITRLKTAEIVAVVRVTRTEGEVADRGTWINTRVHADVERVFRVPPGRELGDAIEFTFGGGSSRIGAVEVSTGKYPTFRDGEQYLVVLQTRRGTASSLTWSGTAFHVSAEGQLQRVRINDGSEQSLRTNLVGRTLSEVADALDR